MLEYGKYRTQKISPDESEDLPGLSAGSSDSEELPDPTTRKLSPPARKRQGSFASILCNVRTFRARTRAGAKKWQRGNIRSLA
jgi:hypothetical protein